ncbi:MAG: sugar-binding domain-containing protein, partial [Limisphaerales bacterium]
MKYNWQLLPLAAAVFFCFAQASAQPRERISLDANWRFQKGDPAGMTNQLDYPSIRQWLLPTGNSFKSGNPAARPDGNLAGDVVFTQPDFDDSGWRKLNLPHDWGIEGPFNQNYPSDTGKLPWWGVAWYRKHFDISTKDAGKQIYLDVDGAMSRAIVWCNGQFVGGWPYGYASWRVDLTPFIKTGGENVLSIRLDNPPDSSRWYPGGGIYRNVWLVKTSPVHVAHWGTHLTTPQVSQDSATIQLAVNVENNSSAEADVKVATKFFALDAGGKKSGRAAASVEIAGIKIAPNGNATANLSAVIPKPKLWNLETPNRYAAVTTVEQDGKILDSYETPFGIRTIQFTATNGFLLNGKRVPINGVCDHHDLGALGSAINKRAI